MKVMSVDPYSILGPGLSCRVFLNGIDMTYRCHSADEEAGTMLCYQYDFNGNLMPQGEILKGKVEIVVRPEGATIH